MNKLSPLLLGITLALAAGSAHASGNTQNLDVHNSPLQQQAAQIRTDLADGKTYSEISSADRNTVLGLLRQMESLVADVDSVNSLDEQGKVDLFNAQERINTILTSAREDSRQLCTREIVTGSHRKQTVCTTVAERERRRQRDQNELWDRQRSTPGVRDHSGLSQPGLAPRWEN